MKRKKLIIIGGFFIAAVVILICLFIKQKKSSQDAFEQEKPTENGMIIASGTIKTDSVSEEIEIDSLDTALYVEEVYLSSGETVEAGSKVLKFTDKSITAAKKELEEKEKEAEIAYKQQLIAFEESKIEAKEEADKSVIEGKYADATYQTKLQEESDKLDDLKSQVEDAEALVNEYTEGINNNYYYIYYQVKELQDECYENFALLMQLYEEWNIAAASSQSSMGASTDAATSSSMNTNNSTSKEMLSIYNDFDDEVSEEIKERDEALEQYESALEKAKYSLEDAKAQYELLNAELQEEYVAFEKTKISLQTESDTAKAEAELAETSYNTQEKKLQEELDTISDDYDTASENLKQFEETIGDGYLYTRNAGTIMMIAAKENATISVGVPLVEYTDTETVTVSVEIDQTNIDTLSVGDSAIINVNDAKQYNGTVTSILPVSQSDSRSSVTYTVTVALEGDLSMLSTNQTATVMIGGESVKS